MPPRDGENTKYSLASDVSLPPSQTNSLALIRQLSSSNHKAQAIEQIGDTEMLEVRGTKRQGPANRSTVALKSRYLDQLADRGHSLARTFYSHANRLIRGTQVQRTRIAPVAEPVCPPNIPSRTTPAVSTDESQKSQISPSQEYCGALRTSAVRMRDDNQLSNGEFDVPPRRLLTTILFTDLVGSTELALKMGDESWGMTVCNHYTLSLAELDRYGGRLIRKTGDGVMAIFDSPTSAVECAQAISRAVKSLGLSIRAGLHSGEVGFDHDGELYGFAAHLAARVCDQAGKDEVLVSRTVRDLVIGSPLKFDELGTRDAKGLAEPLHLYQLDQPRRSSSTQQIREKGLEHIQTLSADLNPIGLQGKHERA
ncbi:MAG: adenylate/guanylate cyclase domain-containing protein [Pseudomonadota bacterium]